MQGKNDPKEDKEEAFLTADEEEDAPRTLTRIRLPPLPKLTKSSDTQRYLSIVERVFEEEGITGLDRTTVKLHVMSFIEDAVVRELACSLIHLPWTDFTAAMSRAFSHAAQLQTDIEARLSGLSFDNPLFVNECRALYWTISTGSAYRISDSEFLTRVAAALPPAVLTRLIERLDIAYPNTVWRCIEVNAILNVLETVVLFSHEIAALTNASTLVRRVAEARVPASGGEAPKVAPLSEWTAKYKCLVRAQSLTNEQLAVLRKNSLDHRRVNRRGSGSYFYIFAFRDEMEAKKWTADLQNCRPWTREIPGGNRRQNFQ